MRSNIYQIEEKEFVQLVKNSQNYSEIMRKLGMSSTGASQKILKRRIKELNIDVSHFDYGNQTRLASLKTKINLEKLLIKDSAYSGVTLKRRILKENLIDCVCFVCKNKGTWNNKKLSLQLDHINGIKNDHRLENLRFLCPNCHSQTETWCFRYKKYK